MAPAEPAPIDVRRSGFVGVAGRPNAGKSTLINRAVGEHVAIVSPIAQTTRRVVRAVAHIDDAQLVFVDLPGSQRPVDRLTERMQSAVEHSLSDVDVLVWVIDMTDEPRAGEKRVADMVLGAGVPVVIAANKVDRLKPAQVAQRLTQLAALIGERDYSAIVPLSATEGAGVPDLLALVARLVPEGPAYFPPDQLTDMRLDERISEYVREAMLGHLRDELPHATIVEVDELEEDDNGVLHVEATIWVERESQVGIVVGKQGATVKQIGIRSRQLIEQMLGSRAHIELRVKVRKRWRDNEHLLERWGL